MLDHNGIPIKLGDIVVCKYLYSSGGSTIVIAKVTKLAPARVKVVFSRPSKGKLDGSLFALTSTFLTSEYKVPEECVIINNEVNNIKMNHPELFI